MYAYVISESNIGPHLYVGKGQGCRSHEHLKRTDRHPLTQKLHKMKRNGAVPLIRRIDSDSEIDAFEMEEFLIELIGRKDLGTGTLLNLKSGGSAGVVGPEGRERIRQARLGKPLSEEHKRAMSLSQMGHTVSEDTRAKLSSIHKGSKRSEETKSKMSVSARGRTMTQEARANLSRLKSGTKLSDSHKLAMSIAGLGRPVSEESKRKISAAKLGRARPDILGRPRSEETKAKISAAKRTYWSKQRESRGKVG